MDCAGGGGERARAKKLLVCMYMEVPVHNEMGTALRTIIFSSVFSSRIVSPPTIKCASITKPDLGACSGWHHSSCIALHGRGMYVATSECKQLEFRQERNSILSSSHGIFSSHSLFSLCGGEHPPRLITSQSGFSQLGASSHLLQIFPPVSSQPLFRFIVTQHLGSRA